LKITYRNYSDQESRFLLVSVTRKLDLRIIMAVRTLRAYRRRLFSFAASIGFPTV